jgi:hypothetical protein
MSTRASRSLLVLSAATAGLVLLASACGGSSTEGVAQVETTTAGSSPSSSSSDPQAAFANCMRENGAPDFPDADSQRHFNLTPQVPRQTPQLAKAYEACDNLKRAAYALDPQLAEGRRRKLQLLLDYAACMRSHGVPNYPDPTVDSDGMGFDLANANINEGAPVFRAAHTTCAAAGGPGVPALKRPPSGPGVQRPKPSRSR